MKEISLKRMNYLFSLLAILGTGFSGSGKATITSLIPRFWDVNAGSISIGRIDIRQIPTQVLNSLISVVFQDVYLFQDTVFNNIRVGKKMRPRMKL